VAFAAVSPVALRVPEVASAVLHALLMADADTNTAAVHALVGGKPCSRRAPPVPHPAPPNLSSPPMCPSPV